MSHNSEHHFITQHISLRGTAANEYYQMIRMGVAGHVKFSSFYFGSVWEFHNGNLVPFEI